MRKFIIVDTDLIMNNKLTLNEKFLLISLAIFEGEKGECLGASYEKLKECFSTKRGEKVAKTLKGLVEKNYLESQKLSCQPSMYKLNKEYFKNITEIIKGEEPYNSKIAITELKEEGSNSKKRATNKKNKKIKGKIESSKNRSSENGIIECEDNMQSSEIRSSENRIIELNGIDSSSENRITRCKDNIQNSEIRSSENGITELNAIDSSSENRSSENGTIESTEVLKSVIREKEKSDINKAIKASEIAGYKLLPEAKEKPVYNKQDNNINNKLNNNINNNNNKININNNKLINNKLINNKIKLNNNNLVNNIKLINNNSLINNNKIINIKLNNKLSNNLINNNKLINNINSNTNTLINNINLDNNNLANNIINNTKLNNNSLANNNLLNNKINNSNILDYYNKNINTLKTNTEVNSIIINYINKNFDNKKELDNNRPALRIINIWANSFKINDGSLSDFTVNKIKQAINIYGEEKIVMAINNYYKAFSDEKYYYISKWNLIDFVSRGAKQFFEDGSSWGKYLKFIGNTSFRKKAKFDIEQFID